MNRKPRPGELRVWWIVNPPAQPTYVPVETPEDAIKVINAEAVRQLQNSHIHANIFGLEVYDENHDGEGNPEWCEWESELGENIDDYEARLQEES